MAVLILGWEWPWRLVQMEELASRYSRPRTSRSNAPRPETMTMGSRRSQSRIWVNGCQTYLWSRRASLCMADLGRQSGQESGDVLRGVRGGEGQTQPGLAAGDGGKTDGGNKDACFAQDGG